LCLFSWLRFTFSIATTRTRHGAESVFEPELKKQER
jgi:hypothetical protein